MRPARPAHGASLGSEVGLAKTASASRVRQAGLASWVPPDGGEDRAQPAAEAGAARRATPVLSGPQALVACRALLAALVIGAEQVLKARPDHVVRWALPDLGCR